MAIARVTVLAQNSELPRKFRDFGATALSSPA
jgi:hypothetical protein